MASQTAPTLADTLNRECGCTVVDPTALKQALARETALPALPETHPHLFSAAPVFVDQAQVARMRAVIAAVEHVVALPAYREHVLASAPAIARLAFGPRAVFLGYDFHLSPSGPKLIEINTNAGGALLNARLLAMQEACCVQLDSLAQPAGGLPQTFVEMFRAEWRRQRGDAPLTRVAIVDDAPETQYLYPEFVLFEQMLKNAGIDALIADAKALEHRHEALWHRGRRIDLVYNRLTDFALAQPEHAALRGAYEAGQAVLTPHPRAHALYADKRNLACLTDATRLRAWGVDDGVIDRLIAGIPRTLPVGRDDAHLWGERDRYFFKPAAGYGSKAAYRGAKLTQRVFKDILAGNYVAQELVAPSERRLGDAALPSHKLDLRNYVYEGQVQLLAARLYQGQTTNFRTQGGGFAPVYTLTDNQERCAR